VAQKVSFGPILTNFVIKNAETTKKRTFQLNTRGAFQPGATVRESRNVGMFRAQAPTIDFAVERSRACAFEFWSMCMNVQVEFLGLSRLVTGTKETSLELQDGATFHDVVRTLRVAYPALVGNVIQPDKEALQAPNIFNLNARQMIQMQHMENGLSDGDRVILMSMSAGG
jgi:molybdopterin converting factor small subunit